MCVTEVLLNAKLKQSFRVNFVLANENSGKREVGKAGGPGRRETGRNSVYITRPRDLEFIKQNMKTYTHSQV